MPERRYRSQELPAVPDLDARAQELAGGSAPWFWLDDPRGRSYVGVSSVVVAAIDEAAALGTPTPGDLHAATEAALARWQLTAAELSDDIFAGGWVGYLGYEYGGRIAGTAVHAAPGALGQWQLVDEMLCVDAATGRAWRVWAEDAGDAGDAADAGDDADAADAEPRPVIAAAAPHPAIAADADLAPVWEHSDAGYRALIVRAQEEIREGNIYQICLTNRAHIPGYVGPLAVHRQLRTLSPSPHGALVVFPDLAFVSSSPETFLDVDVAGTVTTRPIKGTRPRDPEPTRDADLARELAADEKERAENLMIVDLMRNDLTRIAVPGSVRVTGLLEVESFAPVHQLVSTVRAELAPGRGVGDLIAVAFPAGSMTGTPKRAAMSLIAEFEGIPRGAYSGCFGYRDARGSAQLAMTIRTVVIDRVDRSASIGAGGGITILSNPDAEVAEVALKARTLIAALRDASREPATGR